MDKVEIIGITAAILTGISMVPQVVKVIKSKKAENVSFVMVIVLIAGLCMWLWYGIKKEDVPIIATNSFSILVNLVLAFLGIKYRKNK